MSWSLSWFFWVHKLLHHLEASAFIGKLRSTMSWRHGFFIDHRCKIHKKRIWSSNIAMSFPRYFIFVFNNNEGGGVNAYYSVWCWEFGIQILPSPCCLNVFFTKHMARWVDVLQCKRDVNFFKCCKLDMKELCTKLPLPRVSSPTYISSKFVVVPSSFATTLSGFVVNVSSAIF